MITEIKLITTSTCVKCPQAKKILDNQKIKYETYTIDKENGGYSFAAINEIRTVPKIYFKKNEVPQVMEVDDFVEEYNKQIKLAKNSKPENF